MPTDTGKGFIRFFDDFDRKAIDSTNWWTTSSDSGGTAFAINSQHNGVVRGGVDDTDNDLTQLIGIDVYRADAGGPLTLEVRAKAVTSLADGETFIGFSDGNTDENPVTLGLTDVITSNASDAVGFCYTGAGTASWKAVGVKADADTATLACTVGGATTPVVGTYQTFKISINEDGGATFYINGIQQGKLDNAVTPATLINTFICVQGGGTARSLDVDYVEVYAGRRS